MLLVVCYSCCNILSCCWICFAVGRGTEQGTKESERCGRQEQNILHQNLPAWKHARGSQVWEWETEDTIQQNLCEYLSLVYFIPISHSTYYCSTKVIRHICISSLITWKSLLIKTYSCIIYNQKLHRKSISKALFDLFSQVPV